MTRATLKKHSCPDTGILTVRTAIVPGAFSFVRRMFGSKVSLVMGDLFCSYFMWPLVDVGLYVILTGSSKRNVQKA